MGVSSSWDDRKNRRALRNETPFYLSRDQVVRSKRDHKEKTFFAFAGRSGELIERSDGVVFIVLDYRTTIDDCIYTVANLADIWRDRGGNYHVYYDGVLYELTENQLNQLRGVG